MTKNEFLATHIFKGLKNLNDGFDVATIKYFSQKYFEIILSRVEQYSLGIYGIEQCKDGDYYDYKICESYSKDASDPQWYKRAFEDFTRKDESLFYTASYYVPDALIETENITKISR